MKYIPDRYFIQTAVLATILLTAGDYFLFREYELVWPFFWMPYTVILICFLFSFLRSSDKDIFLFFVYTLVLIPVFAGLIMSIAWMIKINFWGEMLGGLIN